MISQAAVQQEQQQNSSPFGCWFHHDPDLQAETQNQIQQSPCLVLLCLNLSLSLFAWGEYWPEGQSMSWTDESDMFNENPPHVYFDSANRFHVGQVPVHNMDWHYYMQPRFHPVYI